MIKCKQVQEISARLLCVLPTGRFAVKIEQKQETTGRRRTQNLYIRYTINCHAKDPDIAAFSARLSD